MFNCTAIPLHFHIVTATSQIFTISWGDLFSSLLISVCVICCRLSCHKCFRLVISHEFVAVKIWLQRCEQISSLAEATGDVARRVSKL